MEIKYEELIKQTKEWLNILDEGDYTDKLTVIGETLCSINLYLHNIDANSSLIRDLINNQRFKK